MRSFAHAIGFLTLLIAGLGVIAAIATAVLSPTTPTLWITSLIGSVLIAGQAMLLLVVVEIADHLIGLPQRDREPTGPGKWRVTGVEQSGNVRPIMIMALNDEEAAQVALERYGFTEVRSVERR